MMGTQKPLIAIIVMILALSSVYIYSDDYIDVESVPSIPLNLTASGGIASVYLDWDEPASDGGKIILEYRIYVYNESVASATSGMYVGSTSHTYFTCFNLSTGLIHYFLVAAVNSKGYGPMANVSAVPINASGNLTVYFIDVGQGDAALIQTPDGKNILIDSGKGSAYSALNSTLQSKSITVIDVLIATHPHEDHIGGLDEILRDYEVLRVYDSGYYSDSKAYDNFRKAVLAEGCPYYNDTHLDPGETMDWSTEVQFVLIHIDAAASSANDASIIIKMSFGTVDFLFTGDAEIATENRILPLFDLDVEILKVGHHGSDTSSGASFLDEVTPLVAVISVGANNTYNHPSPDRLAQLEQRGAEIYRTDLNGSIAITTDGECWDVLCHT